jgi:hypothetical protein
MAVGYGVLAKVAAAELAAWSWSLVAGRRLVMERGRWIGGVAAAVPVAWCVGYDRRRAEAAVPGAVKSR